jgi:hypothetical protein
MEKVSITSSNTVGVKQKIHILIIKLRVNGDSMLNIEKITKKYGFMMLFNTTTWLSSHIGNCFY